MALDPNWWLEYIDLAREAIGDGGSNWKGFDKGDDVAVDLYNDYEITRSLIDVATDIPLLTDAIVEFLRNYTDEQNYEAGGIGSFMQFVDDPRVGDQIIPGRFRQVNTRKISTGDGSLYQIVQTLRRGYAGEIRWDEARINNGRNLIGNTSNADDIANTQSDNPERHIVVDFKNLNPFKIREITESLSNNTYTDPVIGTETYTGTWHVLIAAFNREDDGSGSIQVVLSMPQYTLEAYRSFNTNTASSVFYLWGVPKNLAQTIIDAWKAALPVEGKSASPSYNGTSGTVDLILARNDDVATNLSKAMNVSCDTVITYHFAWGYTETEIGVFLDAHNSAQGSGARREVRIQTRGDGLFDGTVIERATTYDADKHLFTVDLAIGTKVVRTWTRAWNVPKTTLEAVKASYEVQTVGVTHEFTVQREDDCSFDYIGIITVKLHMSDTAEVAAGATQGLGTKVLVGQFATDADLATVISGLSSGPLKRHVITVDMAEDETRRYSIREDTVQKTEGSVDITIGGTKGLGDKIQSGRNVDPAELATLASTFTSGARKRINLSLSPGDAGTFNYVAYQQQVQATEVSATFGTVGEAVVLTSGKHRDALPTTAQPSADGATLDLSANLDDDGAVNYQQLAKQKVLQEATVEDGELAMKRTVYSATGDSAWNAGASDDFVPTAGDSKKWTIKKNTDGSVEAQSIRFQANGQIQTVALSCLVPSWNRNGYTDSAQVFINRLTVPTPTGAYYFFQRLRMNADRTFTGTLVNRVYIGGNAGGATVSVADIPLYYTWKIKFSDDFTKAVEVRYDNQEWWEADYDDAVTHIKGGLKPDSFVNYQSIGGVNMWHAKKVEPSLDAADDIVTQVTDTQGGL